MPANLHKDHFLICIIEPFGKTNIVLIKKSHLSFKWPMSRVSQEGTFSKCSQKFVLFLQSFKNLQYLCNKMHSLYTRKIAKIAIFTLCRCSFSPLVSKYFKYGHAGHRTNETLRELVKFLQNEVEADQSVAGKGRKEQSQ